MRSIVLCVAFLCVVATTAIGQTKIGFRGRLVWNGVGPASNTSVTVYGSRCNWPFSVGPILSFRTSASGDYAICRYVSLCYALTGASGAVSVSSLFQGGAGFDLMASSTIPRLVVFVHGVYGSPAHWVGGAKLLSLPRTSSENGIPSATPFLVDEWRRTHVRNAQRLATEIAAIKRALFTALGRPEAPITIDIVAHNSGGLVARAYIANHTGGPGQDRVDKCVTVGTPHAGIAWLSALPPNDPLFATSPTAREMRTDFVLGSFVTQTARGYGNTRFYLIGGSLNVNPVEPELIPGWPASPNDDGLVSTFSALFAFPWGRIADTATFPDTNDRLPLRKDVIDRIESWLRSP